MKLTLLDPFALFDIKCTRDELEKLEVLNFPPIPETPNTRTEKNGDEVYWVGNRNFLFRTKLADENFWQNSLIQIEQKGLITQSLVSDIYFFLEFRGVEVNEYLASITSMDLESLVDSSSCFAEALGLKTLFVKRDYGFELAFENCYLEMLQEQFHPYLEC